MGDAQVAAYLPAYGRLKTRQYSTPRLTLRLRCWRKGTADGLEEREEDELDDDVGGDWPGKEGEVGHHVREPKETSRAVEPESFGARNQFPSVGYKRTSGRRSPASPLRIDLGVPEYCPAAAIGGVGRSLASLNVQG